MVPSPIHQYMVPGTYTVSLTVTNANGSDIQSNTNYITFSEPWACDTLEIPGSSADESNACQGVLADDGGPSGPYSNNADGTFTLRFRAQSGGAGKFWIVPRGQELAPSRIEARTGRGSHCQRRSNCNAQCRR